MSHADREGKKTICPFYLTTDGQSTLSCEGVDDKSRLGITFMVPGTFRSWRRDRCNDMEGHKTCPLYRAIMDYKYKGV